MSGYALTIYSTNTTMPDTTLQPYVDKIHTSPLGPTHLFVGMNFIFKYVSYLNKKLIKTEAHYMGETLHGA